LPVDVFDQAFDAGTLDGGGSQQRRVVGPVEKRLKAPMGCGGTDDNDRIIHVRFSR
jgi:hypothetical protein